MSFFSENYGTEDCTYWSHRLSLITTIYGSVSCFDPAEDTAMDTAMNVTRNLLRDSLGECHCVYEYS